MTQNEITALINQTTDGIVASWVRSAELAGIPVTEYVELKLDEMEVNEPFEVRISVGAAWLRYAVPLGL